jgi:hypothetical protein
MKVSRLRSIFAACTFAFVGLIFSSPDAHAQSKQKNEVSCTGPGCKWCPDGYVSVNNRDPCVRIGEAGKVCRDVKKQVTKKECKKVKVCKKYSTKKGSLGEFHPTARECLSWAFETDCQDKIVWVVTKVCENLPEPRKPPPVVGVPSKTKTGVHP